MEQQIFNDRYRVISKLGAGGMAEVFKAIDTVLDRAVAIKVLHRHFAEDEDFVSRFRREAQAAASLNHPNIVSIYDWGSQNGTYFIVMELLEGKSLKQHIMESGVIPPAEAMDIAKKVLSALSFAHRHDIVHRDIKPHNMVLTSEGEVKVTDFGIARAGASTMTQTGTILGTAHYLSPEQARGQEVGVTSDIYSMGVVLYEMLTGRVPFDGENPVSIALKHVHEAPVRPTELNPAIPTPLQTIMLKAMAKNPENRYQSASEMKNDVMRLMEGMPIVAVPPDEQETLIMAPVTATRIERPTPSKAPAQKKKSWPAILLVLLLFIGAGAAGGWFIFNTGLAGHKKMVTVPDITDKPFKEAEELLKEAGLSIKIEDENFSNTKEAGVIISQDPAADDKTEEGNEIKVIISKGQDIRVVPDVIGDASEVAVTKITKAGLTSKFEYEDSDEYGQGKVIRSEPGPDEGLLAGSEVVLVISKGAQTLVIPDVQGKASADAKSFLANEGFQVKVEEEFNDDVGKDRVTRTVPIAGNEAKKGSTVTIYVSKGPEMITVPGVVGKLEDEAKAILAEAGFYTIEVEELGGVLPEQDNKVISQDPSKNKEVRKKNSRILIIVGKASD